MHKRTWVIGFFIALAILILIALLGAPVGAMLGMLVLLSAAAIAVIASHVVPVRERTALVVCSALHDAVLRVVPGPATAFLLPFLEKPGAVMDTSLRLERVHVEDVLQADQKPTTLRFTAYVMHQLAPQTLSPAWLGKILPNLTDNLSGIVQHWTNYYLRCLFTDLHPARIHNGSHGRLERHLAQLLTARLSSLGVTVSSVQLVIWPPAGLQATLTTAEQQRVSITLRRELLSAILDTLVGQSEEARNLALLELARSLRDGRAWTSLDLASLMSGDPGQGGPPGGAQLPHWPGILFPADRP